MFLMWCSIAVKFKWHELVLPAWDVSDRIVVKLRVIRVNLVPELLDTLWIGPEALIYEITCSYFCKPIVWKEKTHLVKARTPFALPS